MSKECDDNDYHLDLDSYKPVQPLAADHGVALFPVAAPSHGMDLHLLQVTSFFFLKIQIRLVEIVKTTFFNFFFCKLFANFLSKVLSIF